MPAELERFWSKVDTTGECWLWQAALDTKGYGAFSLGGVVLRAHRFAYERLHGSIGRLDLHHLCENRHCVRPSHLRAMTRRDHMAQHRHTDGRIAVS